MNRKSFTFHEEWRSALTGLPKGVRAEVYEATIEYGLSGTIPAGMKPMASVAFKFIKEWIDNDNAKYQAICERNRTNGRKSGGRPKNPEKPQKPTGLLGFEKQPKRRDKQTDNQNVEREKPTGLFGLSDEKTKEEISPTPLKEEIIDSSLRSESHTHNNACARFREWLARECPYISSHYKPPTEKELEKLKAEYGAQAIAEECLNIENRVDLRKRYSNLYRTLINWLKRRTRNATNNSASNQHGHPTDEQVVANTIGLIREFEEERRNGGGQVWPFAELRPEGKP